MFHGYTQQTVDFMWGIRFNNERSWFMANKEVYQKELLEPTKALANDVYDGLMEKLPHEPLLVKVSRIYRDARRLHGRGPYKDHLWFAIRTGDEDWTGKPTFYFEIAPDYYSYGLGFWAASPATMERFRRHATEHPEELEELTRKLQKEDRFTIAGPRYAREKKAPSDLLQPWFQMKSVTLQFETPLDARIFHRSLADEIVAELGELVPFYPYFAKIAAQAD
jgi:uncharacterized protein (TIGR02453 family)